MSVNKAILIGYVGNDPEVRYLDSGTPVGNFSLATSETYKNRSGERITTTEWHNIVVWRGLAEVAEKYVKKGTQLYIDGRIRTRSWDDRDGNKRYTTEIVADNMQMLGKRSDDVMVPESGSTPNQSSSESETNVETQNSQVESSTENKTDTSNDEPENDLPF